MPGKVRIDMVGLRHGRLVGISFSHCGPSGHAPWLFSCDCGNRVVADGGNVRAGTTTSCGCRHRQISAARLLVHGHRAAKRHGPTYRAWQTMNDSCTNQASPKFRTVGATGIEVCRQWRCGFERFWLDMGERPPGTILERLDAALGYHQGNCRWAPVGSRITRATQGWAKRRSVVRVSQDERGPCLD